MAMTTGASGKTRRKCPVLAGALATAVVLVLSVCLAGQALAAQKKCSVLFICEEYPLWGPMGATMGVLPEGAWSFISDYLTGRNFSLSRKNLKPIKYEDIRGYDIVVYSPLWRYKEEGGFIKHGVDVTFPEAEALVKYVKNGGSLLLFSDENDGEGFSNLNTFTEKYFGIKFLPGVVLSNSRNFYTIDFKSHSITTGFTKLQPVNEVGALKIQQPAKGIAYTSSNCWLNSEAWNHAREQGPDDSNGPFPVIAVTQYGNGKVIGIADDDWVVGWEPGTDEYKQSQKLFLNILGWLSDKTSNTDELKSQPSATHEPSNKTDKDMTKDQPSPPPATAAANQAAFVVGRNDYSVNGTAFKMDVAPFIERGRVFVPLRYLAYALGVSEKNVAWDASSQTIELQANEKIIKLTLNSQTISINNNNYRMDTSPVLRNGRLFLPARWVAEALGYATGWDNKLQAVLIGPPGNLPDASSLPAGLWRDIKNNSSIANKDIPQEFLEIQKEVSNVGISEKYLFYNFFLHITYYPNEKVFVMEVNPYANNEEPLKKMLKIFYPNSYETVYQNILTTVRDKKDILNKVYDGRTFDSKCVGINASVHIGKKTPMGR